MSGPYAAAGYSRYSDSLAMPDSIIVPDTLSVQDSAALPDSVVFTDSLPVTDSLSAYQKAAQADGTGQHTQAKGCI